MTRLWTGEVFKEDPTPAEIETGYNHLMLVLKHQRERIRSGLPPDEGKKLLDEIDVNIGHLVANSAALEACEVETLLADRANFIDGLEDDPAKSS